jgi:hypothetical protein
MKDLKQSARLSVRNPLRSVSLQIRDYQVTVKVNSPVPRAAAGGLRIAR